MNKKEIIQLLNIKEVDRVEILDTYGTYRDAYIFYKDGEKKYFECGYRSVNSIQDYMKQNKIEYTS